MESPATMTDNHEVGDKEENNVSEAYFDEVMLVIMKRIQWRLQSTTESVIMNKAETGESSLDDMVAVPAKEVAWGLASPTSCTTSIKCPDRRARNTSGCPITGRPRAFLTCCLCWSL